MSGSESAALNWPVAIPNGDVPAPLDMSGARVNVVPVLSSSLNAAEPAAATTRSWRPVPRRSAAAMPTGLVPTANGEPASARSCRWLMVEHGDGAVGVVGDREVGERVAVERAMTTNCGVAPTAYGDAGRAP